MRRDSSGNEGFGHVGALLVIIVLVAVAGAGMYVFSRHDSKKPASSSNTNKTNDGNNTTTPDPYEGWKTATLASPQLSFKYPSDWTVQSTPDSKNIQVKSPVSDGHYFAISLIAGKSQDVNLNFLGKAPGTTIQSLTVDGQNLYLVAQTAGGGNVTGLGLATTPGSTETSFGIIDPHKTNNVTMVASLMPVSPTSSDSGAEYSMPTYTSHAAYQNVVKIFQSLSGDLPQ